VDRRLGRMVEGEAGRMDSVGGVTLHMEEEEEVVADLTTGEMRGDWVEVCPLASGGEAKHRRTGKVAMAEDEEEVEAEAMGVTGVVVGGEDGSLHRMHRRGPSSMQLSGAVKSSWPPNPAFDLGLAHYVFQNQECCTNRRMVSRAQRCLHLWFITPMTLAESSHHNKYGPCITIHRTLKHRRIPEAISSTQVPKSQPTTKQADNMQVPFADFFKALEKSLEKSPEK
jgi:hypothetical protein